jgi:ribosomal protein L44E
MKQEAIHEKFQLKSICKDCGNEIHNHPIGWNPSIIGYEIDVWCNSCGEWTKHRVLMEYKDEQEQ